MVLETVQSLKNRIIFKAVPIGIAHFQKEKDKSEFEKVSEWDTMEEYDNVER